MVCDHITVRELSKEDDHDHAEEASTETTVESEEEHAHGAYDPHLWLSPAAMLEMLPELSKAIGAAIGADLSVQLETLSAELTALDTQIQEKIGGVKCELVSGHDEMGYFADRYGCEVIGAVIPSLSTTSESSAGELADLKAEIETHGVPAIFTGLGTSPAVAEQLASELGVKAVTYGQREVFVSGTNKGLDGYITAGVLKNTWGLYVGAPYNDQQLANQKTG